MRAICCFELSDVLLSQSYELELTANDDEEFREVGEWELHFHDLIEGVMSNEEGVGTFLSTSAQHVLALCSHLKIDSSNLWLCTESSSSDTAGYE